MSSKLDKLDVFELHNLKEVISSLYHSNSMIVENYTLINSDFLLERISGEEKLALIKKKEYENILKKLDELIEKKIKEICYE
jgi:hypothetical protein